MPRGEDAPLPPEASAANVEATSPCTWKSGIGQYETSSPPSS